MLKQRFILCEQASRITIRLDDDILTGSGNRQRKSRRLCIRLTRLKNPGVRCAKDEDFVYAPERIVREIDKLPPNVPVGIYHIKPQFHDEIAEQLSRVDPARISLLEQDKTYTL